MIVQLNRYDYERYVNYWRRYRYVAKPETLRDQYGMNNTQMNHMENTYQKELDGAIVTCGNLSQGVVVLEL